MTGIDVVTMNFEMPCHHLQGSIKVKVSRPSAWYEGIYGAVEVKIYLFAKHRTRWG